MNHRHREWSCEHCGRPTVDAWHDCAENGCAMCLRCTDAQDDDGEPCPVEVPHAFARHRT